MTEDKANARTQDDCALPDDALVDANGGFATAPPIHPGWTAGECYVCDQCLKAYCFSPPNACVYCGSTSFTMMSSETYAKMMGLPSGTLR